MRYPNLKREMERYGVSRSDIATGLRVRPNTVTDWLSGKHGMPANAAFEIRDTFFPGKTVDYLFEVGEG